MHTYRLTEESSESEKSQGLPNSCSYSYRGLFASDALLAHAGKTFRRGLVDSIEVNRDAVSGDYAIKDRNGVVIARGTIQRLDEPEEEIV